MRRLLSLLFLFLITDTVVVADTLNIQLGSSAGRFTYASEMFGGQYGPVDLEAGIFFDEQDDVLAHLGLLVRNDTLDNPFVISIGTRLYLADVGNDPGETSADVGGLAIGGEVLFIPDNLGGLGFGFHYFIAPSIVSFLDAEGITEYGVRLDYAITEQASVYIGYQKIEADLENGETLEVDSSGFVGIGMRF